MIISLLTTIFIIISLLLIPLILMQKGKGSMGIGGIGGGSQMLFGGSGGQDLFQKLTWIFCALFMMGSLMLAIMKTTDTRSSYLTRYQGTVQMPADSPTE